MNVVSSNEKSSRKENNFIKQLFNKLNSTEVNYAVLRNYERLPEQGGYDIDILAAELAAFEKAIRDAANTTDSMIVKQIKKYTSLNLLVSPRNTERFTVTHLDVVSPFTWRGIILTPVEVLEEKRFYKDCCYILPSGVEAGITLIKSLFFDKLIKEKYKQSLPDMVRAERELFCQTLTPCLGRDMSEQLANLTARSEWDRVEGLTPQLQRLAIVRALAQPLAQLGYWLAAVHSYVAKLWHPSGLFVVLMGPDGAGKSTVAEGLRSTLQPLFPYNRYFHGHFGILPRLRKIGRLVGLMPPGYEGKKGHSSATSGETEARPFGPLQSLVYLLYYALDYLLGYPLLLYAKGRGELVIFDRYYYDYLTIGRMSLPEWLLELVRRIIPQPDVVVYLKNDPKVILGRKQELTQDQVIRQNLSCSRLIFRLPQGHELETRGSAAETIAGVQKIILEVMAQKGGAQTS